MKATVEEADLRKLARWLCRHWDELGDKAPVDGLIEAMELLSRKVDHAGLRKRVEQYEAVVTKALARRPRR